MGPPGRAIVMLIRDQTRSIAEEPLERDFLQKIPPQTPPQKLLYGWLNHGLYKELLPPRS